MPKQGTRTFFQLLRSFGIGGMEGRRLSFALANDVAGIVDVDDYDPMDNYVMVGAHVAAAGTRGVYILQSPPNAHCHITAFASQFTLNNPQMMMLPNASLDGIVLNETIIPIIYSGLGNQSEAVFRTGEVAGTPFVNGMFIVRGLTSPFPLNGLHGRGWTIGPGQSIMIMASSFADSGTAGFHWFETRSRL